MALEHDVSTQSVLRRIAKQVREVEAALPTSCTWESSRLNEIADDLIGLAGLPHERYGVPYQSGSRCGKPVCGFWCNRELQHPGYCSYTTPAMDLAPRPRVTKDIADRNALAAEWLQMRIKRVIKETEREFGVYIKTHSLSTTDFGDFNGVELHANIWPEAMRIIEPERESKAIG